MSSKLATYPFLDFAIEKLLYGLSKGLLLGTQQGSLQQRQDCLENASKSYLSTAQIFMCQGQLYDAYLAHRCKLRFARRQSAVSARHP